MAPRDLDCGDDVIEMDDDDLDAIDVLGTGAVMKKILKEAPDVEVEYGHPETGDQCKIAYEGYVLGWDDERMRSEKMCHRNYLVTLGSDDDIKGWSDALETMYQGEAAAGAANQGRDRRSSKNEPKRAGTERRRDVRAPPQVADVTIKPHRAYGKMGSPPDIPGNATVLFKLELLSFTKKADVSEKRDGSVLKHVVHEGEGGTDVFSLPNKRCDIYYSYKLRLPYDGTVEPLDEDDDAEWLAEDAEHGTPVGLRLGLETMRRGERARFTMYANCHGVRGLPDLGLRPRDRIVYEVKMKCWVESVDVVRDKKGAVVKRIMKAIHHTKSDPPDEFDRVRVQGHVSLSDAPDVVVAVLGDRDDFDNSYATWKLRDARFGEIMKLLGDGSSAYDESGFDVAGGWFDEKELPRVTLCPGLDEAVKSMRVGEIADVEIRADYGDGDHDAVPADAVGVNLDAHLQLISYDKEKAPWDLTMPREIIELAEESKESGNAQAAKKNWAQAARRYKRTQDCCKCAMCHLKLHQFKDAKYEAAHAVELDAHNVKARFRLASANIGLRRLRDAEKDLVACLKDEPYNKEIKRCLLDVRTKLGLPPNGKRA
ncbi:FK506 binding protein [Aureococcus anophagefferens]|nr:FK506 binding protein [Aureococcus anophagefferens]